MLVGASAPGARMMSSTSSSSSSPLSDMSEASPHAMVTVADVVEGISDPSPMGWSPPALAEAAIVAIHGYFGLEWWMSIGAITLSLRLLLFPVVVYQMKNIARLNLVKPEMEVITNNWRKLGGYSAPPRATDVYQKQLKELFAKHHCNPWKSFIGLAVQGPIFVSFFFALRHMATTYPSFKDGGTMWFQDLSIVDPTYMLPVIASLSMLATIELGGETGQAMKDQQSTMKFAMRGFAVAMVPLVIMSGIPNGVFLYWIPSNVFSLLQVLLLKVPFMKSLLGFPKMPAAAATATATAKQAEPVIPKLVYSTRPKK